MSDSERDEPALLRLDACLRWLRLAGLPDYQAGPLAEFVRDHEERAKREARAEQRREDRKVIRDLLAHRSCSCLRHIERALPDLEGQLRG